VCETNGLDVEHPHENHRQDRCQSNRLNNHPIDQKLGRMLVATHVIVTIKGATEIGGFETGLKMQQHTSLKHFSFDSVVRRSVLLKMGWTRWTLTNECMRHAIEQTEKLEGYS